MDHTPDIENAQFIHSLVYATMEDGSPIRPNVKAEVILAHFGIPNPPPSLCRLVSTGITRRMMRERSNRGRGQANV